jgi:hypothetical protein
MRFLSGKKSRTIFAGDAIRGVPASWLSRNNLNRLCVDAAQVIVRRKQKRAIRKRDLSHNERIVALISRKQSVRAHPIRDAFNDPVSNRHEVYRLEPPSPETVHRLARHLSLICLSAILGQGKQFLQHSRQNPHVNPAGDATPHQIERAVDDFPWPRQINEHVGINGDAPWDWS